MCFVRDNGVVRSFLPLPFSAVWAGFQRGVCLLC